MKEADSPLSILAVALLIFGMSVFMLYANYRQFEVGADLKTASGIMVTYLAAAVAKRIRAKQREKREEEN